jgi:LuxR family maltose regulon positive regulatory protein
LVVLTKHKVFVWVIFYTSATNHVQSDSIDPGIIEKGCMVPMDDVLILSKLRKPPLPAGITARRELVDRLNTAAVQKLTLISAPAGYGKSTLLAEWAAQSSTPVAWLSLDRDDDDPLRFWMYVVSALQTIPSLERAGVGRTLLNALSSQQPPPLDAILSDLVNEITMCAEGFVLVLDDLHAITNPQIHAGLAFFVDNLLPGPDALHLVIASRIDPPWPLARLRARGELSELRTQDLRFTTREVTRFLGQILEITLPSELVAALDSRTEGWAAGLQMAAISMRSREQSMGEAGLSEFIQSFTGSHRFVLDFLIEEVLVGLPVEIHDFLLQTSILERFQASLCDAVGNRKDSASVLSYLEKSNLFLIALDDERQWYRYHSLFADLLQKQLRAAHPEWLPDLHLRASEWYEGQGLVIEAVNHALEVSEYERVVLLIQKNLAEMFYRGELSLLQSWLDVLPEEILHTCPDLCAAYAWTWLDRSPEKAEHWMAAAEAGAAERSAQDQLTPAGIPLKALVSSQAASFWVSAAVARGDPPAMVIGLIQHALEVVPEADAPMRGMLALQLGIANLAVSDRPGAERALAQARQLGETSGSHYVVLSAAYLQADLAQQSGRLADAIRICQNALADVVDPIEHAGVRLPIAGPVYLVLVKVLLERNQLSEAEMALDKALQRMKLLSDPSMELQGLRAKADLLLARDDLQELSSLISLIGETLPHSQEHLEVHQARLWLRQSQQDPQSLALAVRWADQAALEVSSSEREIEAHLLRVRIRIAQFRAWGQPGLEPALTYLAGQAHLAEEYGWGAIVIEIAILQAMAFDAAGQERQASEALARALALAAPQEYVRLFLNEGQPMARMLYHLVEAHIVPDYASRLLHAFKGEIPRTVPGAGHGPERTALLVEPLTEREVEVLALMAEGLSNQQIALQLSIAAGTVKKHADNLYGKLGVHKRSQAVARARTLGLI